MVIVACNSMEGWEAKWAIRREKKENGNGFVKHENGKKKQSIK